MENAKKTLNALIEECKKHSSYVQGKINRGIEENRKGLFRLRFLDSNGEIVNINNIHINQISHEFKFGAPLFVIDQLGEKDTLYKERFKKIFNYAVLPMYHKDVETSPEKYRFEKNSEVIWRRPPLDVVTEFCRENNIRMKAHCLAYNSFNPNWFETASYRDINMNIDHYMEAIGNRYGKDILDMDVINEMFTIYKNGYVGNGARDLPITDERDHISKMFAWAKKYFPHTRLFWNEGSFETFGNGVYKGPRSTYYMMLREQIERGVPIEGIGMQYHLYATVGTDDGDLNEYRALCNPLRLFDALDCYSEFNLPIHISEISVPSYSNDIEMELLQAELTEYLYSLFFSQKNVDSLVWWNLCDNMAYKTESVFHTGLMREDLSPKPVYETVDRLINHQWHTEMDSTGEANKDFEFIGFYGDYEISFMHDGKFYKKMVSLYRENTGFDNKLLMPRAVSIRI